MNPVMIAMAGGTMLALALVMAWILGWANRKFHVETDARVAAIEAVLPGANCGGCGYVGCSEYAEAVVRGEAAPDLCTVGGEATAREVAAIMGVEVEQRWAYRPAVHCGATYDDRLQRSEYHGEQTCAAANLVAGVQGCTYGCLGFGDCVRACDFDAIHIIDGLAVVDYEKCVGCGACARACPRNIISMIPFKSERMLIVACSNKDSGKDVRAVCKVGCIGCGVCHRTAADLFSVKDHLSQIDYDQYDPEKMDAAKLAVRKCPMRRLVFVGKPSEKDIAETAGEEAPAVATADFKTTVDRTGWRG